MSTLMKYLDFIHLPLFNSVGSSSGQAAKVLDATKSIADSASRSFNSIQVSSLSPGVLFATLVIVGVLLLALTLGRTRTLISVMAIYVAFALQAIFPFFNWLLEHQSFSDDLPTLRVFVFLALYAIVFGLLNRSLLKTRFNLAEASFSAVVLTGFVQLGFIISIILNLAPSFYDITKRIPPSLLPFIGGQHALFYWALVPIILLIFQKHSD